MIFLPSLKAKLFLKLMPTTATPRGYCLLIPGNSPFIYSWLTVFISSTILVSFQPLYFLNFYPHFLSNTLASQFLILSWRSGLATINGSSFICDLDQWSLSFLAPDLCFYENLIPDDL